MITPNFFLLQVHERNKEIRIFNKQIVEGMACVTEDSSILVDTSDIAYLPAEN